MTRPQWWIFCDISFAAKTKALQVEKDKPVSKETNTPEKKVSNAAELKRWERHSRGCTMCTRLVLCAHILFQQGMIPPSHAAFTGHGSAIPCSVYRAWFRHPMQRLQGMVPPSHAAFTGHGSAIPCSVYRAWFRHPMQRLPHCVHMADVSFKHLVSIYPQQHSQVQTVP